MSEQLSTPGQAPQQDESSSARAAAVPMWVVVPLLMILSAAAAVFVYHQVMGREAPVARKVETAPAPAPTPAPGNPSARRVVANASPSESTTVAAPPVITTASVAELTSFPPTLVSLHHKDTAPKDIVTDLAKQIGVPITAWPEDWLWRQSKVQKMSIDVDKQPFWLVLRQIGNQVGFAVEGHGPSGAGINLTQSNRGGVERPMYAAGPFLIVAQGLYYSKTVDLARPTDIGRNFALNLVVHPDPKLAILGAAYQGQVLEATDDKGNSLVMPGQRGGPGFNTHNIQRVQGLSAQMVYPQNEGSRITKIKGTMKYLLALKSETWEITDLSTPNQSKTIDGKQYWFEAIEKKDNQYEVKLATLKDLFGADDRLRGQEANMLQRMVLLVDATGKQSQSNGWGSSGRLNLQQSTLHFSERANDGSKLSEPVKLIWTIPTQIKEVDVPFEFTDLPLP